MIFIFQNFLVFSIQNIILSGLSVVVNLESIEAKVESSKMPKLDSVESNLCILGSILASIDSRFTTLANQLNKYFMMPQSFPCVQCTYTIFIHDMSCMQHIQYILLCHHNEISQYQCSRSVCVRQQDLLIVCLKQGGLVSKYFLLLCSYKPDPSLSLHR